VDECNPLVNGHRVAAADTLSVAFNGSQASGVTRVFPALAPEPPGAPPRRHVSVTIRAARMALPHDLDFGDAQTALSAGVDALKSVGGLPFLPRRKTGATEASVHTGRGLHSSTFRLDVSTLRVSDLVVSVSKTAQAELRSG